MKKSEAAEIVMMLMSAFPSAKATESTSRVYESMLVDLDAALVRGAITRLLATSKFLPSIAEIREAATAQSVGPRKTGAEAYEELLAAVQRYGHYPEVRWVNGAMRVQSPWPPVPPDVARAVRQTWGSWDACCTETGPDAPDRARFIAAYDGLSERERADLVSGRPLPAPAAPALKLITQQQKTANGAGGPSQPAASNAGGESRPAGTAPPAPAALIAPPRPSRAPARDPRRWTAEELDAELAHIGGAP